MPQNWWEAFPEIVPSPAARPRPLPGPGAFTPGPAMDSQPVFPIGTPDLAQSPADNFDPSFLSNGLALGSSFDQGPFSSPSYGSMTAPNSQIAAMAPALDGVTDSSVGEDDPDNWPSQPKAVADKGAAFKAGALVAGQSGGDPKLYPPQPGHHHAQFSAPHTGGPAAPPQPNRSYRVPVGPDQRGGGLNGWGYVPQTGDAQLLARLIYSESGITPGDMPAIGWAAVNRIGYRRGAAPAFGSTLSQVVFQPARHGRYQYSFLNDGGTREWHDSENPSNIPAAGRAKWARAVAVANAILARRVPEPSGGAHYFFASPSYVPGRPATARPGFAPMLQGNRIAPTPYQSTSTATDHGRLVRNYFFRENPVKLWLPDPPRNGRN